MDTVISAGNIKVVREGKEILAVDSLELGRGEVMSVLGPNGAGKSTLLQVLALLTPLSAGEVRFMGEAVTRRNALSLRRRMAVVFQEPLLLNTTVYNNVSQGLKFRGVGREDARRRVGTWLERMGIAHLAGRTGRFLSGGEAQRVSLARALALQPEVLFLDEPFSALDFSTRSELVGELAGIVRESGITTFFVTHDYSEIPAFGGKVLVLRDGRVDYRGTAESLFDGDPAGLQVLPFPLPERFGGTGRKSRAPR